MAEPGSPVAASNLTVVERLLVERICARVREHFDSDQAPLAEDFVRHYFRRVPPEDLAEFELVDLYGAALAHFAFARHRTPGTPKVRVYNPEFEQHGWTSPHTVVEMVTDDMPFLVDSTTMELGARGSGIHVLIHPVMRVVRDAGGDLVEVLTAYAPVQEGERAESCIHVEVDRHTGAAELKRLRLRLLS